MQSTKRTISILKHKLADGERKKKMQLQALHGREARMEFKNGEEAVTRQCRRDSRVMEEKRKDWQM